jgi:hypothetical protein
MDGGVKGFQPGREKTGGIKKGMKHLSTLLWEQLMDKYKDSIDDGSFVSPMSFYVSLLNDISQPVEVREKAASTLIKYFSQQMPTLVEQTITSETPIFNINFTNENEQCESEL